MPVIADGGIRSSVGQEQAAPHPMLRAAKGVDFAHRTRCDSSVEREYLVILSERSVKMEWYDRRERDFRLVWSAGGRWSPDGTLFVALR